MCTRLARWTFFFLSLCTTGELLPLIALSRPLPRAKILSQPAMTAS